MAKVSIIIKKTLSITLEQGQKKATVFHKGFTTRTDNLALISMAKDSKCSCVELVGKPSRPSTLPKAVKQKGTEMGGSHGK